MAIDFKVLEEALGYEEGTLSDAASSEEVFTPTFENVKIYKKAEHEELMTNHENELLKKQEYSKQVGEELLLKKFKEE